MEPSVGVLRIWQSKTGKYRRSHPIFGPVLYPQNGAISGCFANLTVKNMEIFEKPCFLTKNERGWPTFLNSGDPVFDSQINKTPTDGSILRIRNMSKTGVPRLFRTYQTPHRWEHVANCCHFEAKFETSGPLFWTSFWFRKWSHQWGFCESDCQKQGNIGDLMTLGIPIWALFESFLQLVFSIYSSKTRALPVWLERVHANWGDFVSPIYLRFKKISLIMKMRAHD